MATFTYRISRKVYKVKGSIWIENDDVAFIGSGRIHLLEMIKKHGSITLAAKALKMSYRQAWELVNSMNTQSAKPLIATSAGGAGGGGTRLTNEGEQAIKQYRALQKRFHLFNARESRKLKL